MVSGKFPLSDVDEFIYAVELTVPTKSLYVAAILADCDDSFDPGVLYRACITWETKWSNFDIIAEASTFDP